MKFPRRNTRLIGMACALGWLGSASLCAWVPDAIPLWLDGPVSFAVEVGHYPPSRAESWDSAALDAMNIWNAHLQRVQFTMAPATGQPWYDNGRNEIFFDDMVYGSAFPDHVIAITCITSEPNRRVETDIVFNATETWSVYRGPLTRPIDFRRVVVHELGHALGLAHPDDARQSVSAIMNSVAGDIETPTPDDQAGIHALYDRGPGPRPLVVEGPVASAPSVVQGTPVGFYVGVGGRGPFTYLWRRNGEPIPDSNAPWLLLSAADLPDAGVYSVAVTNSAGVTISPSVTLAVVAATPPQIQSMSAASVIFGGDPYGRTVLMAGADFWISAYAPTGSRPLHAELVRNGVVIDSSPSWGQFGDGPIFTRPDMQLSDAGDYAIRIANAAGTVTSGTVRVTVNAGGPPRITADPTSAVYPVGDAVALSAKVGGGPGRSYQWQRNGIDLPGCTQATLEFSPIQLTDAGSYTVTVANAFGQVTSGPATLIVTPEAERIPLITEHPRAMTQFYGATSRWAVHADGTNLRYRWYHNGTPLTDSASVNLHVAGLLVIEPTTTADAGLYSVQVSNSLGTVTSREARLTVAPPLPPVIVDQPTSSTVAVGGAADIRIQLQSPPVWPGDADPNASYSFQWYKDGAPLAGSTRIAISFGPARLEDAGRYHVRATSPAGAMIESEKADLVVTAGALPLITMQPGNLLFDSGDAEVVRLGAIALEIIGRRATRSADTSSVELVAASGPSNGSLTPGTYVIKATKGAVTEKSRLFTIGFLPAIVPVLAQHPASRVAEIGATFAIYVEAFAFAPVTYQWSKNGAVIPGATDATFQFSNFAAANAGSYQVAVSSPAGIARSEPAVIEVRGFPAPAISLQPVSQTVTDEGGFSMNVAAAGSALRYQWMKDGQPVPGGTETSLSVPSARGADGTYTVVVSNGATTVTSSPAQLRVLAAERPPKILFPPLNQTAVLGGDVTFVVGADGGPLPDHYQWHKGGIDLPGASDAELRLHRVDAAAAGSYSVTAYNRNGSVTSVPAFLTIDLSAHLVNLSTRAKVGNGSDILVAGFVISGSQPRTVLVRAIGDQLSDFGVTGVLRNPVLELFDRAGKTIARSDDWSDVGMTARLTEIRVVEKQVGAFPMRLDTQDGALLATLPPGSYTAQVSGVVSTTGIALVEVYQIGAPSESRLVNLSCRSLVGTGAEIMIPGLVLSGQTTRRLLVRAIGPGLAAFNISAGVSDLRFSIWRDGTRVAENDNWSDSPSAAAVAQAAATVGAFPLVTGSKDAALLVDLPPGAYTIQVAGVNDATGIALVEIYEVP